MSTRDEIRSATLGQKKSFQSKTVESNGVKAEVRQPTVKRRKEILNAVTDESGNVDGGDLVVWAAIHCTFEPDSDEKVFSEEDFDAFMEQPTGSFVDDFGQAALELMNVSGEGKNFENSDETPNSKTN